MEGQYFGFTKADPINRQIAAAARTSAVGMS
jgi:hypothetical protein